MVLVIVPPVVLPQEDLDGAPRGLDGIRVGSSVRIDKLNGMIDGAVRETL